MHVYHINVKQHPTNQRKKKRLHKCKKKNHEIQGYMIMTWHHTIKKAQTQSSKAGGIATKRNEQMNDHDMA